MPGSVQDSLQVTQASRVQRRSRPSLQQLREPTDVPEWRTQIVGYRIGERLKLFVGFFELYGALLDSLFELLVEKTDLLFCPLTLGDLLLGFLVEPSVVHGHGGPTGKVLSQLQVGFPVAHPRFCC